MVFPRYPKGFIFTSDLKWVPADYISSPLPELWISTSTTLDLAFRADQVVCIIGLCVSPDHGIGEVSGHLADSLSRSEEEFLSCTDGLCGRYAIIYRVGGRWKILTDATGMRSVFFRIGEVCVASHAKMIATEGGNVLRFRMGYPGNGTPFCGVVALSPSCCLDIENTTTTRFWPRKALPHVDYRQAGDFLLDYASAVIFQVSRSRQLRLGLTAGLDSRIALAALQKAGCEFVTYTYGSGQDTLIDRKIAKMVASEIGVPHHTIATRSMSEPLGLAVREATYFGTHYSAIEPLRDWFSDETVVSVSANLLEIGRCFYSYYESRHPQSPPATVMNMRNLYIGSMPQSFRSKIPNLGETIASYDACFALFMALSHFNQARGSGISSYDQFYWEHRMAKWHGMFLNERDFYSDSFVPFNSRAVLAGLLGVPVDDRKKGVALKYIIDGAGLGENLAPINPTDL